jgi:hypothetical protein
MPTKRLRQQFIVSEAIQRVLSRTHDRLAIGSLAGLKRAYESELAEHGAEIVAKADRILDMMRETDQRILHDKLRCVVCDCPIDGIRRISRRYCSDRCRQRAHRQAARA